MKGRERERTIDVWLPLTHPVSGTWPTNQACALDWKANWQPFGASTPSTEPHQPGLFIGILKSTFSPLLVPSLFSISMRFSTS